MYREELIRAQTVDKAVIEKMEQEFKEGLKKVHAEVQEQLKKSQNRGDFMEVPNNDLLFNPFPTGVSKDLLLQIAKQFSIIPEKFQLHPKVEQLVKDRLSMAMGEKPIDWGMGEYLAYATLLWKGIPIRISGQDCCRGTFSHRHALWVDQATDKEYYPLAHLKEGQGKFEIYNSPLSEFGVLGFEYGYSVACPQGLTIWEAQYGDFANEAQVIMDQYIVSGEQKWGQKSRLVLYLPHGYEGQGPEHSSGRLERFLTLAGHDNIQVVNPTTPAQLFHLLRRQVLRPLLKPLIIFTPKKLLRYPPCTNKLQDFTEGSFQAILDDPMHPKQPRKLAFCSGHIYYDLIEQRQKDGREDIAFVRIEQLYPLDQENLKNILKTYSNVQEYLWVQEEHQNMGAWSYIHPYLSELLPKEIPLIYAGRDPSASPATGSHSIHKQEHINIINQVFSQ